MKKSKTNRAIMSILMLIMTLSLILTACNKQNANSQSNNNDSLNDTNIDNIDNTNSNIDNADITNTNNSDNINSNNTIRDNANNNYNITYTTNSYELGMISIDYPILSVDDTSDSTLLANLDTINSIIYNDAISVLNADDINEATDYINIDYTIYIDNDGIVSVKFSGDMSYELAAHPSNIMYTSNTNIYTGNRVTLIDEATLTNLANNFVSNQTYQICASSNELALLIEEYLNTCTTNELYKTFEYMDFTNERNYPLSYSYKDENGTYVIIEVPTAIGQYAILQIII